MQPLDFIIFSARSSNTRQCLRDCFFYLTVMFLSWNWEKVSSSGLYNIKKDCKIHIEVPENY